MSASLPAIAGFTEFARKNAEKLALICEPTGDRIRYGELNAQANRVANALRSLGVQAGDCIAICLPNGIALVASILAAQRIGIYFTLLSPKASVRDIRYILDDSGSCVLLCHQAVELALASVDAVPNNAQMACRRMVCSPAGKASGEWETLLATQSADLPAQALPGMEMIYSSGTTGRPKGVRRAFQCKTWGEVDMRNVEAMRWLSGSSESVYLSTSPMYHSAPYRFLSAFLDAGATAIIMDHFDAELSLDCIDRYAVTHGLWVPTMFQRLLRLDEARRARFSGKSMTHAIHGAAPCPRPVKQAIIDWWGPIVYEYYSGTEGVGRTFINSQEWVAHPGSVGKPSHCLVHILDEQGHELPIRQIGHIFFESPVTFTYWNDQEKTQASISPQGWRTYGDIGFVDEDGYLYLTDRSGFMVISGGVNLYPQEIENTLLLLPDVLDAAVFGVPDDDLGEKLVAVVQLADAAQGTAELAAAMQAHCRHHGGSIKTPRLIRFCTDFPRLETGKVQKRFLRDQVLREPQPWANSGPLWV
jgi:long-chain acyl-CoA synthetase